MKAQGVFLWVFLVVLSLLEGLNEDDDMATLRQRLDDIPEDLEDFFRRMLNTVGKIYHRHMARSLLLACSSDVPLPIASYWYMDVDMRDPNFALHAKREPYLPDVFARLQKKVVACVTKWCRGLLEPIVAGRSSADIKEVDPIFQCQVGFLHRTVRDFLLTDKMQSFLLARAGPSFRVQLTMTRIFLMHAKTVPQSLCYETGQFHYSAARMMSYVYEYEARYAETCAEHIRELDRVGSIALPATDVFHWSDVTCNTRILERASWSPILAQEIKIQTIDTHQPQQQFILRMHRGRNIFAYALEFGLHLFVSRALKLKASEAKRIEGAPLIYHALSPIIPSQFHIEEQKTSVSSILMLLDCGCDPNQPIKSWNGQTVWQKLLKSLCASSGRDVAGREDFPQLQQWTSSTKAHDSPSLSPAQPESPWAEEIGGAHQSYLDELIRGAHESTSDESEGTRDLYDSDKDKIQYLFDTKGDGEHDPGYITNPSDEEYESDTEFQTDTSTGFENPRNCPAVWLEDPVIIRRFASLRNTCQSIKNGRSLRHAVLDPEDVGILEAMLHHGADPYQVDRDVLDFWLEYFCQECQVNFARGSFSWSDVT